MSRARKAQGRRALLQIALGLPSEISIWRSRRPARWSAGLVKLRADAGYPRSLATLPQGDGHAEPASRSWAACGMAVRGARAAAGAAGGRINQPCFTPGRHRTCWRRSARGSPKSALREENQSTEAMESGRVTNGARPTPVPAPSYSPAAASSTRIRRPGSLGYWLPRLLRITMPSFRVGIIPI